MTNFLLDHWLAVLCVFAALSFGATTLLHRRRHGTWAWPYYLLAAIFVSYGLGAFAFLPWSWLGLCSKLTALGIFLLALVLVFVNGSWFATPGYVLTCLFFFGLGDWSGAAVASSLRIAGLFLLSLRVQEPWWLVLLLAAPVLFWTSYRNLVTLGPARRWIVLGLRCSLIVLLAAALAEAYGRKPNEGVTVIFLWDRSLSIAPEFEGGKDVREERIFNFINQTVALRGSKYANANVGVIVFGKQPRLELPPARVTKLGFTKVLSQIDNSYTDIAAALKLALASFPEGAGKRIVLITDGNENIGRADEQAQIAKQNGVQIDVIPIAAGRKHQNEILVERIEAPAVTEKGARLPLRVVVRSFHPQVVVAQLSLRKITFDPLLDLQAENAKSSTIVKLRQGLQRRSRSRKPAPRTMPRSPTKRPSCRCTSRPPREALVHKDLPGDRGENNQARVVVMSRGQRAVLILEDRGTDDQLTVTHQLLVDRLRASHAGMKVVAMTPNQLRRLTENNHERLAIYLSKFDAVFLANVPAESH